MLFPTRLLLVTLGLWLLMGGRAAAQPSAALAIRLKQADQVILASHHDFGAVIDENHHPVPAPPFVVNGQPNPKFCLKSKLLTPTERLKLSAILSRPYRPGLITVMKCCMPNNTLFLVEKHRVSYFDICLSCRCLGASHNLELPEFDNRRWKELDAFVEELGLGYRAL